jgi:hypothetical protein
LRIRVCRGAPNGIPGGGKVSLQGAAVLSLASRFERP